VRANERALLFIFHEQHNNGNERSENVRHQNPKFVNACEFLLRNIPDGALFFVSQR
jgi:hypothetical protein